MGSRPIPSSPLASHSFVPSRLPNGSFLGHFFHPVVIITLYLLVSRCPRSGCPSKVQTPSSSQRSRLRRWHWHPCVRGSWAVSDKESVYVENMAPMRFIHFSFHVLEAARLRQPPEKQANHRARREPPAGAAADRQDGRTWPSPCRSRCSPPRCPWRCADRPSNS